MCPLANALDLLQGQDIATAGYLHPTLFTILEDWEHMQDLKFTRSLAAHFAASVRSGFSYEFSSDYFKVAAALHPDFRLNWCMTVLEKDEVTAIVCNALCGDILRQTVQNRKVRPNTCMQC